LLGIGVYRRLSASVEIFQNVISVAPVFHYAHIPDSSISQILTQDENAAGEVIPANYLRHLTLLMLSFSISFFQI
jgi:hypothetical protein